MAVAAFLLFLLIIRLTKIGAPQQRNRLMVTVLSLGFLYVTLLALYQAELIYGGRTNGIYGSDAQLYFDFATSLLRGSSSIAQYRSLNGWGYVLWDAAVMGTSPAFLQVLMIKIVNILLLLNVLVLLYKRFEDKDSGNAIMAVIVVGLSGAIIYTALRNLKETLLLWLVLEFITQARSPRISLRTLLWMLVLCITSGTLRPFIYVPMILFVAIGIIRESRAKKTVTHRSISLGPRLAGALVAVGGYFALSRWGPFKQALNYVLYTFGSDGAGARARSSLAFDPMANSLSGGSSTARLLSTAALLGIPRFVLLPVPLKQVIVGITTPFADNGSYFEGLLAFLMKLEQSVLWWILIGIFLINLSRLFSMEDLDLKLVPLWEIGTHGIKLLGSVDVRSKVLMYALLTPLALKYLGQSKGRHRVLLVQGALLIIQVVYTLFMPE